MALKTKIKFQSIDKTGGIIKVKDTTGNYSIDNPEGYGFPNTPVGDINKIILTISQYSTTELYTQTYVRVADPNNPQFYITPTINQITSGTEIDITSISLGLSSIYIPFEDGVFDLNMYSVLSTPKTGIIAAVGNPFVIGTDLETYLQYDSILIANKLYDIDKTKNMVGGTILYLVQEIEIADTQFYSTYRANTKFMTDMATTTQLYNKVGKLASNQDSTDKLRLKLYDIELFKWASQYAFDNGDYIKANELIISAQMASKHLNCNC